MKLQINNLSYDTANINPVSFNLHPVLNSFSLQQLVWLEDLKLQKHLILVDVFELW